MATKITTETTTDIKVNIEPEETATLDDKDTATTARSAMAFAESASGCEDASPRAYCRERVHRLRGKLSRMFSACEDVELNDVYDSYSTEIDKVDE